MLDFPPQYYSHIYIWLVALLSISVFRRYASDPLSRINDEKRNSSVGILLLMSFLVLFIGLRPVSEAYFVDMVEYSLYYNANLGEPFSFDWSTDNLIFDNYLLLLASYGFSQEFFFLSIALVYFGCMAWACSSLFPRDKMAAFLVCLGAFSSFSYGTNGIKAGAAASLFLVALAFYTNRRLLWAIVFALVSLGFHHSMLVPLAAFSVCFFVKNSQFFFAFWVLSFFMALFHISFFQQLFAGFADEQGSLYLSGASEHVRSDILGGFRIDFIMYSAAPIIVGWLAVFKKKIVSREFSFLLNVYLLTNSVWLLCMYAEFTNRIAYLSWFLLPIVLVYPLLNEEWGEKKYQTFRWIALGHLGFTLFMQYIFY